MKMSREDKILDRRLPRRRQISVRNIQVKLYIPEAFLDIGKKILI